MTIFHSYVSLLEGTTQKENPPLLSHYVDWLDFISCLFETQSYPLDQSFVPGSSGGYPEDTDFPIRWSLLDDFWVHKTTHMETPPDAKFAQFEMWKRPKHQMLVHSWWHQGPPGPPTVFRCNSNSVGLWKNWKPNRNVSRLEGKNMEKLWKMTYESETRN